MRSPPKSPPAHTRSSSSIKPAGTAPWNSRSRPTLAPAVAAALTRAQQPRKYLAIHAPELAIEPHLQILRRYRRSLLLRLEHPHRPAMEDHVHRTARLGFNQSVILRIGIRFQISYFATSYRCLLYPRKRTCPHAIMNT